ncbi:MAG: hypothetical protein R2708_21890 [Vicinamibacterales bacterium]
MRASRLLAAIVAAAAALTPAPARADVFVSPFLGVKFRGATNQLDLDESNGVRETKSAVGISGVVVSDDGPGLEIDIAHQSRFFEGADDSLVTRSGVTTLSANVMLAAPIAWTRESLRPFAVAGLGWMHAASNDQISLNPIKNDYLGLTMGVGAVGFLTDVVGLRFDLRYLKSVSSADTAELTGRVARLSFWRATIGVVFR